MLREQVRGLLTPSDPRLSASQSPFRQLECVAVAVSGAGVRRSRRFDSWSASQSPFRQLECVSHYFSGRLEAMSACDDDRHFEILAELLHAGKGH